MTMPAARTGHYGFSHAVHMEWIKLRSLRSSWWTLATSVAGAVGVAVAVGASTKHSSGDLTNDFLAGIFLALLTIGVLGVLVTAGEHSTGMIRATLAAVPNRPMVLAAKALVFGGAALAAGEAAAFIALFAGDLSLRSGIAAPTLGQPEVLRAVTFTGAGICLIGLVGLGLGAVIRHTPAAVGVLVGGVFVAGQIVEDLARHQVGRFVPMAILANSLSVTKPDGDPARLPPLEGLGMLALYAAIALLAGGIVLTHRDA